jgi:phytoene dehydrogenase-like protein
MNVSIIGGGISGLSLGCYLQMNGFETTIYEKHAVTGGLCASWKRGEYTFDGCLHWVMGSDKGSAFYRLWSDLIDMSSVDFVSHDVKVSFELEKHQNKYGEKIFHLYTDLFRLETYLTDLAPEDSKRIRSWISYIRACQKHEMPPNIDRIHSRQTLRNKMSMMKYLPFFLKFLKWRKVTNISFAKKLNNPFLREAFEMMFDGDEVDMMMLTMPMAFFDNKSAGYPIGGSARFAQKIHERFQSLGGTIHLGTPVKTIITEDDKAVGLLLGDGRKVGSDIVVSAADWHFTMFDALEGKHADRKMYELKNLKILDVYPSVMLVTLGVNGDFSSYPHFFKFPLKEDFTSPDGTTYKRLEIHVYHYDKTLAPEGKTVIAVSLYTRNGEFWIDLRNRNPERYRHNKKMFTDTIINLLEKKFKGMAESIEEIDLATPATFYRYTGNWKGSVQGWFPPKNLLSKSPVKHTVPGLKNFYYSCHWSIPGGGLPSALKSSSDLAQYICRDFKRSFRALKCQPRESQ